MIVSCKQSNEEKSPTEVISTEKNVETEINILVPDTIDDNMMLLGHINEKGLHGDNFIEWYKENYNDHILDTTAVKELKTKLDGIKIKVFMGTWCSDSQREVPALYKILKETDFNLDNLENISVSQEKDTPNQLEKGLDIEYVPTIIFYKNENEIGRYVELAQETLEKDMLAILNETGYKHSYEE